MIWCTKDSDCTPIVEYCSEASSICEHCSLECDPNKNLWTQCNAICPDYLASLSLTKTTYEQTTSGPASSALNAQLTEKSPELPLIFMSVFLIVLILVTSIITAFILGKLYRNKWAKKNKNRNTDDNVPLQDINIQQNEIQNTFVTVENVVNDNCGLVRQESNQSTSTAEVHSSNSESDNTTSLIEKQNANYENLKKLNIPEVKKLNTNNGPRVKNEHKTHDENVTGNRKQDGVKLSPTRKKNRDFSTGDRAYKNKQLIDNNGTSPPIAGNLSQTVNDSGYASESGRGLELNTDGIDQSEQRFVNKKQFKPKHLNSLDSMLKTIPEEEKVMQWNCEPGYGLPERKYDYKNEVNTVKTTNATNNQAIYEALRGTQFVEGYYSEGKSITVYIDLLHLDGDWALDQICTKTGAERERFHLCHSADQD